MIKKIEHIAIIVKDMDQSIAFYSEMFHFKVRLRGNGPNRELAFLYLEGQPDVEIELIQDFLPDGEYNRRGIVNHLAFTVEDLDESIHYYKEKDIEFMSDVPQPTLEGGRMILFHDPNGELLQLIERIRN